MSLPTLIDRVHSGKSAVELVYTSHERWPLPRSSVGDVLRVAVLDSSFNPPTLAHLALANAPLPNTLSSPSAPSHETSDYDAKLLLLSVRNADKKLNPGDANYIQRLEMMILLARDIVRNGSSTSEPEHMQTSHPGGPPHENVAVAIIDEPTFVGKSQILHQFLRHRLSSILASSPNVPSADIQQLSAPLTRISCPKLVFLVGMDTLERLFATRYYPSEDAMLVSLRRFFSSDGDDASVVCARRALSGSLRKEDEEGNNLLESSREFLQANRVILIDIGEHARTISSTQIRHLLQKGDSTWRNMVTVSVAEYIVEHDLYRTSC